MLYETRDQWGSSQSDPAGSPTGIQDEVVIHHAWKPHVDAGVSIATERSTTRGMQDYHVEEKGWDDISYSFVVYQSGRAYEGRGWFRTGAHAQGHNEKPSILFVINGDDHTPTKAAWATARALLKEGVGVGALTHDYTVAGHTDYANKSCPGRLTYPLIREQLAPGYKEETSVRTYAQAIVVPTPNFQGKDRSFDRALGAVLANTYGLGLVETNDGSNLVSITHFGERAEITAWAGVVGAARWYVANQEAHGHRIAGDDRWDTAAAVAEFIQSHPVEDWARRGRPF